MLDLPPPLLQEALQSLVSSELARLCSSGRSERPQVLSIPEDNPLEQSGRRGSLNRSASASQEQLALLRPIRKVSIETGSET